MSQPIGGVHAAVVRRTSGIHEMHPFVKPECHGLLFHAHLSTGSLVPDVGR